MNQLFYNIATTTWVLKHVLFVIDCKVLTMYSEGKQRILLSQQFTVYLVKKHLKSTFAIFLKRRQNYCVENLK